VAWNVVIAGGGFGGLYAARRLERVLPRQSARITVVSDVNFLLYTPLLPGAAAGTLEPRHVVVPIREELDSAELRLARVTSLDPAVSEMGVVGLDGRKDSIGYDQLIVSLGSVSRVLPVPGLAEHGVGFKTLSEAIALRNRVILSLELAEASEDPDERDALLSFVFVGAGYAGLEGIAELQDFVAHAIELYPHCRLHGTRWILVEAQDRVMQEISAGLAEFATRELRGRGIEIRTGTFLEAVDENTATLSTGERIPARTVCWTAGVKPPALVRDLGLPLGRDGRIVVDATMRVEGHQNVWAIGDAAAVPDPAKGGAQPSPPTCQHALRQGRAVASNVAAELGHGRVKPFSYKTRGVFVDMGRHKAVAEVFGIKLSGFPAWWTARTYHLAMMPGTVRKLRLLVDWTVDLLFGRGTAELGQLGHPPSLRGFLDQERSEGLAGEDSPRS